MRAIGAFEAKNTLGSLLDLVERQGVGAIVFSPLGQGLLTDRYLDGVPEDSRVRRGEAFDEQLLSEENLARVRALNKIAARRGQSLAQLAIAWVLRDRRVSSALEHGERPAVLFLDLDRFKLVNEALEHVDFSVEELAEIDRYAVDGAINIWAPSSDG